MKKKHILNVGYPKSGTSWCWAMLEQQSWFSIPPYVPDDALIGSKENYALLRGESVSDYVKRYNAWDITANFCPAMLSIDRMVIAQLEEVDTISVGIILRNPYEIYWSLYNFLSKGNELTFESATSQLITQGHFNRMHLIVSRWNEIFTPDRFKVFYYDDLQQDSRRFFNNFCKEFDLPEPKLVDITPNNVTKYTHVNSDLSSQTISIINSNIDDLEKVVNKDLSSWKQ
jgi:hypothetical protein